MSLFFLILLSFAVLAYLILFPPGSGEAIGAPELETARLAFNERTLTISDPIKLSGRIDQVWKTTDNILIIVDTKTRRSMRVFASDIMQLSAYRFLLSRTLPAGKVDRIADYGYIRFKPPVGKAVFKKVQLLNANAVIAAHGRALQLLNHKKEMPQKRPSKPLCDGCGHYRRCNPSL